jgi:hypothetical protein
MSKDLTITAVEISPEKLRVYDEICGAAFVNLFTLAKDSDPIVLCNFDPANEEHLFVLGVAKGLAGTLGKKIGLDVNRFQLWKLNRGIDKECRMVRVKEQDAELPINPDELLSFMRPKAVEACGNDFTFADIYNQYYNRKKGK